MPTLRPILGRSTQMHFGLKIEASYQFRPAGSFFRGPMSAPRGSDWITAITMTWGQSITPLCPAAPVDPMPVVCTPPRPYSVPEPSSVLMWVVAIGWFLIWRGKP